MFPALWPLPDLTASSPLSCLLGPVQTTLLLLWKGKVIHGQPWIPRWGGPLDHPTGLLLHPRDLQHLVSFISFLLCQVGLGKPTSLSSWS